MIAVVAVVAFVLVLVPVPVLVPVAVVALAALVAPVAAAFGGASDEMSATGAGGAAVVGMWCW